MTRADLTPRLVELGQMFSREVPLVLDAALALLESIARALAAARLERYELRDPIGAGGQAEVRAGFVHGTDGFHRPVAIKRLRADHADPERFGSMLVEEAHRAARLSHPNVVAVLDLGRDAVGQPYLVMEHVAGVDLARLAAAGPVPFPVVIYIVRELLAALGYIHAPGDRGRGLVHRDVTPRNVLLSWTGAVKLADFGVAQVLRSAATAAGACFGSPGYMSPEQARHEPLDGRSDLYAVGIILWELLARRPLRVGLAGDPEASVTFDQPIPRPSADRASVPADLEAVTLRLLSRDRAGRYRTADLAARALLHCPDAPRDGRAELVHLLNAWFPRAERPDPREDPPASGPAHWAPCHPGRAPWWPRQSRPSRCRTGR